MIKKTDQQKHFYAQFHCFHRVQNQIGIPYETKLILITINSLKCSSLNIYQENRHLMYFAVYIAL